MRTATHWPAVLAVLAAGIAGAAAIGKMSPALPLLQSEFHLSLIAAGWLASMFNTIALSGALAFGLLSTRVGPFRFCLFGLGCMIAGGVVGAFAPQFRWLVASRILEGMGFVAIIVTAPGLIAAASALRQRGLTLGLWGSYMPIGVAAAITASPYLFAATGWRGAWAVMAIAAAAVAAILLMQSGQFAGMHAGVPGPLRDIRSSLARAEPWLLGTAFSAYALQFYVILIWLPTYLQQTRSSDSTTAAMLTAVYVITNAFGTAMGTWFMHRGASRGLLIGATFAFTALAFLGIFASGLPDGLRFACVLAYSFVTGNIPPAVLSGGVHYARSPAEAGTIQGLIVQISHLGIFASAPLVASAVTWRGSWDAALWVMLANSAIGLAASYALARREAAATRGSRRDRPRAV